MIFPLSLLIIKIQESTQRKDKIGRDILLQIEKVEVLENRRVQGPFYYLELYAPTITSKALPGQFLHITVQEGYDPILRRPLSLHRIKKEEGSLGILYQVKGRGTALLTKKRKKERVEVLGPCGQGFELPSSGPVLVVAGGIGVAPLGALVEELTREDIDVDLLQGAVSKEGLLSMDAFLDPHLSLYLATEDGSEGYKGRVTDLFKALFWDKDYSLLYGCGPLPMLEVLLSISSKKNLPCQISLEGRMGCGMGFCLTCGVKKKSGHGYHRLCTEGPVFRGEEVSLHGN